jgi:hypothetical protein
MLLKFLFFLLLQSSGHLSVLNKLLVLPLFGIGSHPVSQA